MRDVSVKNSRRWLSPIAALNRFKPPPGMSAGIVAIERQRTRYGFRIGDIGLLVGSDVTSEVLVRASLYPLPKAPIWMAGLVNLRGNLAPVFDMKPLLELDKRGEIQDQRHVLLLGAGDAVLGILIDGLPRTAMTRHPLSRLPPLPSILQPCVSRAYAEEQVVWLEFDHDCFFRKLSEAASEAA